jgi:hypothetical protein
MEKEAIYKARVWSRGWPTETNWLGPVTAGTQSCSCVRRDKVSGHAKSAQNVQPLVGMGN